MIPEAIKDLQNLENRRHRMVWRPFMEKYDVQSFCEIGVFESQNFKRMLESNPKIAVGVDVWRDAGIISQNDSAFSQDKLNEQANYFKYLMSRNPAIRMYRQLSHEAVANFPDEYFDLIYIDGDHTFDGCYRDMQNWWAKLKSGKYFVGDDFRNRKAPMTGVEFGVVRAVQTFCKHQNLTYYELPNHRWAIIKP
jgi:hypothetical protein